MRSVKIRTCVALAVLSGCAARTPGGDPHEMSAAHHEAAARRDDKLAANHRGQYQVNASEERFRCSDARGRPSSAVDTVACWTSTINPTEQHRRDAEAHRRHAADHRAGSESLRRAEAQSCAGIAPDDRDTSPFDRVEDITAVAPHTVQVSTAKGSTTREAGAIVTFRAVPGMTAEWLQRIVDCHVARNASLGHMVPEMPNCPLVPNGVQARVSSTGNGFAVVVQSNDVDIAQEILARATRLLQGTGQGSK